MNSTNNQNDLAIKAWDILVEVANKHDLISNIELANQLNISVEQTDLLLAFMTNYCNQNKQPRMTLFVTGFFDLKSIDSATANRLMQEIFWILDFDSSFLVNPFKN